MDDIDAADVRAADDADRSRIWADFVSEFGRTEASRRWLAIFGSNRRTAHRLIEDRYDV